MAKQKKEMRLSGEQVMKKHSQWRDVWHRMCKNKVTMASLILVTIIILSAIFAPLITVYDYGGIEMGEKLLFPSLAHPLGTDNFGRDLLTRIIYGGRISLLVALETVVIAAVGGIILGSISGFFGGWVDGLIMRITDIFMAIPPFLLAVVVSTALGTGITNTAIAIALGLIPPYTRVVRGSVMTIKDQEYIEAATALGSGNFRIILRHVLPNTLSPIIVQGTMFLGAAIMQISSLSYVGLGVQPPTPEWGSMISSGLNYIRTFYPIVVFPGIAILLTIFGFNLLGDGLRDALDPKLKN